MRRAPFLFGLGLSSCLSYGDRIIERELPEEPMDPELIVDRDGGAPRIQDAGVLDVDPHALQALSPNHGPFSGGQTVTLRGNGFASNARVWFGDVPAEDVIAVDPNRIQATTPPGSPGSVDISVQLGDDASTRRKLVDGYEYDAFTIEPSAGPTTGGSLITLRAPEANWDETTSVSIDLTPCEVIEVRDGEDGIRELDCRTPEGTPGQKVVSVETSGDKASVAGGFAYTDFATEFEGGLSGDPIEDRLEVRVLSGLTGQHLPGATVVLGSEYDSNRVRTSDENGSAVFENGELGDAPLASLETITVLMPCTHPLTLVDVPVDTATVYLEPILTPACVPPSLEIPGFGGGARAAPEHAISGELVWGEGLELRRGPWVNVPAPSHDDEERIAYVFELTDTPGGTFSLPTRLDAVTTETPGNFGYSFGYETRNLGNVTLYALAGVEDRTTIPRKFTPYALGVIRGIDPSAEPTGLLMAMNITLDHALEFEVEPPETTALGPDRVQIELSLRLGPSGYVRLPNLSKEALVPRSSPLAFVGVPALALGLERAEYTASATLVSGPGGSLPISHLELISTRQTDTATSISGFVPIPEPLTPLPNAVWNGRELAVSFGAGGDFNLLRFDIAVPSSAVTWRVIAPGERREIALPSLAEHGFFLGTGSVNLGIAAARIQNFDYAVLKERNFGQRGWSAYALNAASAVLP